MNESTQILGWTLVHFCWQAAVLAIIYRVADTALARSRSNVRYVLALAAMMSMLLAALATFGYEEIRLAHNPISSKPVAIRDDQAQANGAGVSAGLAFTVAALSADVAARTRSLSGLVRQSADAAPGLLSRFLPWIDALWLAGVLALSCRMLGGWLLIRKLRMDTKTPAPASVYAAFAGLAMRLGIEQKVDLFLCAHIYGPLAMGVLRSIVFLPVSALTHLSPDQLEVVLAHELAHIRRKDYLWNMVQTLTETLFFFHPAVWWLGGRLRQLREVCCDDVALECCGDPVVYATALLRLEEQRSSQLRLAMALNGHDSGSGLKRRIVRILDEVPGEAHRRRREMVPLSLAGVSTLLGLLLLPVPHVFAGHTVAVQSAAANPPAARKPLAKIKSPAPLQGKEALLFKQKLKLESEKPAKEEITPESIAHPIAPAAPSPNPIVAPVANPMPVAPRPAPSPHAEPANPITPEAGTLLLHPHVIVQPALVASTKGALQPSFKVWMMQQQANNVAKTDYINEMRAAGYDDLDKLIAMKIQGITPEYAHRMSQMGYGKPTAEDLVSLKIFNVTPELVDKLRGEGIAPAKLRDLIAYQIFKVTPEFVAGMKDAGFSAIPSEKLVALRVQKVTPEYAKAIRQKYPDVTVDQLVQLRIFHIDDEFIASAKGHGFDSLTIDKLVKLRISGLLDDNSVRR